MIKKAQNQNLIYKLFIPVSLWLIAVFISFGLISCGPTGDAFLGDELAQDFGGYIVVANATSKSVVLLDPNGKFVRDLVILDKTTTDTPWGVAVYDHNRILVTVEGVDRVIVSDLETGEFSDYIVNSNLTGTMRGLAVLLSGDILISEGNTVEKFRSNLTRTTTGGWPLSLQTTGTALVPVASTGGFVHCSTGSDVVRVYSSAGTQTASAASGIGGTTDVTGCAVSGTDQVAASFAGTTDSVRVYSDLTLGTTVFTFSETSTLGNPGPIAFRPNGNLLVIDQTNNLMVELDSEGNLESTISSSAVSGAASMLVIP